MKKIVTVVLGLSLFVSSSLFAKSDGMKGMNCDASKMEKGISQSTSPSNFKYLYPDTLNNN